MGMRGIVWGIVLGAFLWGVLIGAALAWGRR